MRDEHGFEIERATLGVAQAPLPLDRVAAQRLAHIRADGAIALDRP